MAEYKIHNRMTHWQKTYPAWISFAAIAFLLAVWEIICSTGLISSLFLPAPSAILTALGKLITSGEISRSLTASLYRILLPFISGFSFNFFSTISGFMSTHTSYFCEMSA